MQRVPDKWDKEVEVLVIGTGYAGLTSTIEAHDAGSSTLILEKRSILGGNSIRSGGGANAVDPNRQLSQNIEDSFDLHYEQTFRGGASLGDPKKIRFLVDNALNMCVNWLESLGVEWPINVVRGYGALWERTHVPAKYKKYSQGAAIFHALMDAVKDRRIRVYPEHNVSKIIREKILEGKVVGVKVDVNGKTLNIKADKAIILASGGFGADLEMVRDHDLRLIGTPTTCHTGSTGECLRMAQDIGAEVLGMDHIQCVPTIARPPFKGHFFIISCEETQKKGTPYQIFVNREGNRFVREDGPRDDITFAALTQTSFDPLPRITANSIRELEIRLGIAEGNLIRTLEKYNLHCESKCDSNFNRHPRTLLPCKTPPFRAQTLTPGRHHTMGGLKVQGTTGRVMDRWRQIIPHFYATGEVTGGIHGANRLGFNAIPECIIFGRTAGKLAAQE
jgi:succinate dehydrogenase/fumarate reductase flavoprotein subunit